VLLSSSARPTFIRRRPSRNGPPGSAPLHPRHVAKGRPGSSIHSPSAAAWPAFVHRSAGPSAGLMAASRPCTPPATARQAANRPTATRMPPASPPCTRPPLLHHVTGPRRGALKSARRAGRGPRRWANRIRGAGGRRLTGRLRDSAGGAGRSTPPLPPASPSGRRRPCRGHLRAVGYRRRPRGGSSAHTTAHSVSGISDCTACVDRNRGRSSGRHDYGPVAPRRAVGGR